MSKELPRAMKHVIILLLTLFSVPFFFADLGDGGNIFDWLSHAIDGNGFVMTLLCIGLYFIYFRMLEKVHSYRGERIFSAFIAISFLFGDACSVDSSLSPIFNNIIKSICLVAVYFFFALAMTRFLHFLLIRFSDDGKIRLKHPFILFFIVIIALWLPQLIIKFPGTLCYDNVTQMAQYFGYTNFSSNHPMTHTLLLGICMDFGLLFGSANLGLFTAVLLQSLLLAAIFAYTLVIMYKLKSPTWVIFISLVFYTVTPNIIGYISIPLKDIPYSAFYVLFTASVINYIRDEEYFWKSKKQILAFVFSGAMIVLLRNNGLIAVIPIILYISICTLKKYKAATALKRVCSLLLTFVITVSVNAAIDLTFSPESGSRGEAFSFTFQQTARFVRDHSQDVTEKEAEIINNILDYENIGSLYDARICDPVKATFKTDSSISDLFSYLGLWAKQFFRHPLTYFEATVSQNYSLFYPQVNNIKYYPSVQTHHELQSSITEISKLHGLAVFDAPRDKMTDFYTFLHNMPIIGMLSNIGFITLLLIALIVFSMHHKLKGMLPALAPALLTIIMCILSPVIMLQSRYAFPAVYSMPLLVAFFIYMYKRKCALLIDVTENLQTCLFDES